ncbi:MAG: protoheme IX farnesyltransferase [Alphaproteobacteria bacterium]|nr:protoheme IX farnesyltransferase [Alphaproteobacteria bacterium]
MTLALLPRVRPSSVALAASPDAYLRADSRRLGHFLALMKPRVMFLAVFTGLVGLLVAPGTLDLLGASLAVLAIAAGAGAAGVLNMWYDADIDAIMSRTAGRPIPRGKVARREALVFGLLLAGGAIAVLALATNALAAGLLAFTIAFYVGVYTVWLKRSTPQNIVIGGAAGALPPLIGWAAATGTIGLEPSILFMIIFLWTPPHFWALSLNLADDYAEARVPMLPVVAGSEATARQILLYSALLVPASLLPFALGFSGAIYAAIAGVCGVMFLRHAFRLWRSHGSDARAAHRLFIFSISYLFLLFAALLADHGVDRLSARISPSGFWESANCTAISIGAEN